MLDYLVHLTSRLGHWGYAVIFLGAMLESAAFLGVFVPGESLVLVAGFLSAQGLLDLGDLIVVVAIGATLGDNIGYELGRRLGRPWALRYGRRIGITEARLLRTEEFFSRYGGKAVLLGRFVGFARALVPFIAGSTHMRYRVFLGCNALGAALWAASFVLLGYFLGASWQVAERWIGRGSAIVGGAMLAVLALGWLWRWMVRHEAQIRQHWARASGHPLVAALLKRFAPQIAWLRRRLSPEGYFGLQLTLGLALFAGAAWMFGGIAEDVVTGDPLTVIDTTIAKWLHEHSVWWLTAFAVLVSRLHEWFGAILSVFLLLYLLSKRDWRWALTVICTVPGGMLLNVLLKLIFSRARPTFSDLAATLHTYSFPSGHVIAAVLIYGVMAAYVAARVSAWRWRVLTVLVALGLVVLVAFSRMYLGVHYLSDVLAAAAAGVAWFALCHVAVNTLWHRRRLENEMSTH